jgi:flagellar biogenesis protein FliO
MAVYIPDEQGELTALADTAIQMTPPNLGASAAKMFFVLFGLIALLAITYWFLRRLIQNRLQKGTGNSAIQILEKRMISPKTMLYLVEIENKKVLIAESHLEIKSVAEISHSSRAHQ